MTLPHRISAEQPKPTKELRLSEREITAQVIGTDKEPGFIRMEGWLAMRLQSGVVRGQTRGSFITLGSKGLPDWICAKAGHDPLFVEVKASDGELQPDQIAWHAMAKARGLCVITASGLGSFIQEYRERFGA